jgi:hypothetical protein
MRPSFKFTAIAVSAIQIAIVQTIAVAAPVSNLNQITTEVSVKAFIPDSSELRESAGAIIKKDRDSYYVLLKPIGWQPIEIDAETMKKAHITTFDGKKYPIEGKDSGLHRN